MEPPSGPQALLLFQVLFPCVAALLSLTVAAGRNWRNRFLLACGVAGIASSLILMGQLLLTADAASVETAISFSLPLSLTGGTLPGPDILSWTFAAWNGWWVCLLSLLYCTTVVWEAKLSTSDDRLAIRLPQAVQRSSRRACPAAHALPVWAGLNLALLADDLVSLFTGLFLSMLAISIGVAQTGSPTRRAAAGLFLNVQTVGLLLLFGGWGVLVASVAIARTAPYGLPGPVTLSVTELGHVLQSTAPHPAAQFLWNQYLPLPLLLIGSGIVLCAGIIPLHAWMSRALGSANLAQRLWVTVWTKLILVLFIRALWTVSPEATSEAAAWGLWPLLAGCLLSSLLLLAGTELPRLLAGAVVWSHQFNLLMLLSMPHRLHLLTPLLISHAAGLILLIIVATEWEQRLETVGSAEVHAPSATWGWAGGSLFVSVMALSLTPGVAGMLGLWMLVGIVEPIPLFGISGDMVFLFTTATVLAGLLRLMERLLTTGPRAGELPSPGWAESACLLLWVTVALLGSALALGIPDSASVPR